MMRVDVTLIPSEVEYCSQVSTAVVIDVLRASTTINTALYNGAALVATFATVEQARCWRNMGDGRLLGGERKALPIDGFELGNSPLEYTPDVVRQQQIGLTTTNGTFAVERALERADTVLIGSLLNVEAIVEYCRGGDDLLFVCAGTQGRFSLEDAFCAGVIMARLGMVNPTDSARVAQGIYGQYKFTDPVEFLRNTTHGARLEKLGFSRDIEHCAKVDSFPVIPRWNKVHRAFVVSNR
jgi:2-phosphosulfolactate phosphatase